MISVAPVIVGQCVGRIKFNGLRIVLNRLIKIALSIIGASSVVKGCLEPGIELKCPGIIVNRFFRISLSLVRESSPEECVRIRTGETGEEAL